MGTLSSLSANAASTTPTGWNFFKPGKPPKAPGNVPTKGKPSQPAPFGPLSGLGISGNAQPGGRANTPVKPVTDVNDPRFQAAANAGMFGPVNLQQLMQSDAYKAYGNNNQAYDAAYQNAMNASRANITQMYGNAIADINNRQGIGNQMVGQLPGQINAAYNPAEAATTQQAQVAQDAQKAAGLSTYIPAAAISQPGVAALETSKAARVADIPLISGALANEFGKERTAADNTRLQAESDLNQKEADHAASTNSNEPTWIQKMLIDNFNSQQQAKAAGDAKAQANLQKQKQAYLEGLAKMNPGASNSNGKILATNKAFADEANAVRGGNAKTDRSTKAYIEAVGQIQGQIKADPDQKHPEQLKAKIQALQKKYPKQAHAISLAMYDQQVDVPR